MSEDAPRNDKPQNFVFSFLEQLKSSQLLMLLTALFVVDLFIPDPLPFVDEAILGLLTLMVARWKSGRKAAEPAAPPPKPPPKNVTPADER